MGRGVVVVLVLALVACAGPGGTAGTAASPRPPGSVSPGAVSPAPVSPSSAPFVTPTAPAPTPVPPPTPAPACWPFRGGTSTPARVTDVRVGAHDGYDRLVIEFDRAVPYYEMMPNQAPPGGGTNFTGAFSGLPIKVAGSYGVFLLLSNLSMPGAYPHGADLQPGYPVLEEVRLLGDFEARASFGIGLSGNVCPDVTELDLPARLVIDFPTG